MNRLGTVLWSATLPLAFFLFPDGQPPSRGWWRVAWLPVVSAVAQIIPIDAFVAVHLEGLRLALYLAGLATAAIAIIARFRASVGLVRLQLAWIGYAGALVVVAAVVRIASLITTSQELANLAYYGFVAAFWLVPLAAGLAILRYRLYDIGLVIRRTIVYGATTAALAVTFFSLVLLIEAAVRPFTGGNELAIAGSTLATVAVFQPLRARIQELVDRRFYRSRYDAARTLDAFSVRLRDEVNLDAVRVDLVDAVQRTVQPAHASVWLRERPGFSEAATSRWP